MTIRLVLLAWMLVLAACGTVRPTQKTAIQSERLGLTDQALRMSCPARLVDVVDDRPHGESAGMYGLHDLRFEDAIPVLRQHLVHSGLVAAPDAGGMAVTVRLKRLYMSRTNAVNTPVVVLEVSVDQRAPFVVRPNATTINWAGSQKELHEELQLGLAFANRELVMALNRMCTD